MSYTFGDTVRTYQDDLPLFKKLGLTPFSFSKKENGSKWVSVGTVKLSEDNTQGCSVVDLYVMGLPAQFWKANIYDHESNKKYTVTTGSGAFSNYWPIFEKMATNMVVVESLTEEGKENHEKS